MAAGFEGLSPEEICAYVKEQIPSISDEILERFKEHEIDGSVFLELNDEYLREIAPRLGDRLKLKRIITRALNSSLFSSSVTSASVTPRSCSSPIPSAKPCTSTPKLSTAQNRRSLPKEAELSGSDFELEFESTSVSQDSIIESDSGFSNKRLCAIPIPSANDSASSSNKRLCAIPIPSANDSASSSAHQSESGYRGDDDSPSSHERLSIRKGKRPVTTSMSGKEEVKDVKSEPLALDWADNISLPTRFSKATSEAIESGVLTRRARVEIHNAVATLILVHTSRPNSNDRDIICRRLVTKVPALKDSSPSGYASWKEMLRTKFKNLRRPARAQKSGIVVEPPQKRPKAASPEVVTESDLAEYRRHVTYLQQTYQSKKWTLSGIQLLLEQTSKQRTSWIHHDSPSVKEVLDVFPCFADPQIMLQEFCTQTGVEKEVLNARWLSCQVRLLKYAPLEQRKAVKSIVRDMETTGFDDEDHAALYSVLLMCAFLSPRAKSQEFVTIFEGESIDIESSLEKLDGKAPCIVGFGQIRTEAKDFKVVIENDSVISLSSIKTTLHFCFAAYYIFNISFPNSYRLVLLFLEKYVYGIKPSQKTPMSVQTLIDSLEKIS